MAKKTIRLPDFEGVLAERGKFWSKNPKDGLECVTALARHYGVTGDTSTILEPATPPNPFPGTLDQWCMLAFRLAMDLVPAFRTAKKGGTPKRAPQESSLYPSAHAARLVQIVETLQRILKAKQLPASRADAFRELARRLKVSPYPKWRYGTLRKPSSFAQAWKDIPKNVKANPHKYIPDDVALALAVVADSPDPSDLAPQGLGVAYWLGEQDRKHLAGVLPPVPMR